MSASTNYDEQLLRFDGMGVTTNGYRDATGHDEQKVTLTQLGPVAGFDVHTTFEWTNLNQETGGFVIGYGAYKDNQLRKSNPNPESLSRRVVAAVRQRVGARTRLRHRTRASRRTSAARRCSSCSTSCRASRSNRTARTAPVRRCRCPARAARSIGAPATDFEWAYGDLYEFQEKPAQGSAFIVGTRPVGVHYDYDVTSLMSALHYDVRYALSDDVALVHSARLEWLGYDYNNHALDGNTRDDGTPCGFGGCLYTRPPDRDDSYTNTAFRLGVDWSVAARTHVVRAGRQRLPAAAGDRTVSSAERPERRRPRQRGSRRRTRSAAAVRLSAFDYSTAIYAERSTHVILRDANGFNVSNGKLESAGIEWDIGWTPFAGQPPVGDRHVRAAHLRVRSRGDRR